VASYITAMEQHRGPEQGVQQQYMFKDVDWKCSTASVEPFPDLKIAVVKEVVSTGGRITAPQDTPQEGGQHLSPEDFHQALQDDNIVLIDVRNKNEFDIGHFEGATNPKTRTFSEFPKYLDDHAKNWKADKKKVLMYCTGGIRCEKASIMVKAQGVEEVFQLAGGIHRYLERYPDGGKFLGKNLVFDRRVAMCSENTTVVGRCVNCSGPWDSFQGNRVCCVCRDPILACPPCQKREKGVLYCEEHMYLKHVYYYFIDGFTAVELEGQRMALEALAYGMTGGVGQDSKRHKNKRRTIRNQIGKIEQRLEGLNSGPHNTATVT
jgi:predicted sulfurtransferase